MGDKTYFIAPQFDSVTEYSQRWCTNLFNEHKYSKKLITSEKDQAKVLELVNTETMVIFCFYDHGSEEYLWGSRNNGKATPIVVPANVHLLKGIPIYTMACLSTKILGRRAIEEGVPAYFGYIEPFGFYPYREAYFEEQGAILFKELEKGKTWKEGFEQFKKRSDEIADTLDDAGESMVADQILYNKDIAELLLKDDVDGKVEWGDPTQPDPEPDPVSLIQRLIAILIEIWEWIKSIF